MKLEKSQTLQCLINAFAGESQARNRYTFYSKKAKKDGYEQISQIFSDTAENELEHAKLFYKHIPDCEHYQVSGQYPFFNGSTLENLESAYKGEKEEWDVIYKQSAQIAKDEGFDEISELFERIAEIEKYHSHRFEIVAKELNDGTFFAKKERTQWVCRKCGTILISKNAPEKCPTCSHPQGYFQVFNEKY